VEKLLGLCPQKLQFFSLLGLHNGLVEVDALTVDDLDSRVVVLELLQDYEVSLLPHHCLLLRLRENEHS
jgi:hypothetical protein